MTERPTLPDSVVAEKVIPVARGLNDESAPRVVTGLIEGGLSTIEVTVERAGGLEAIAAIDEPTFTVGAGSVTSLELARDAVAAGATFLVSPHFDPEVVAWALAREIVMIPGGLTPTEIHVAWSMGVAAVKVFPVSAVGAEYVRALLAPSPQLKLIPTGGVAAGNISGYLAAGAAAVGVGGWLTASGNHETVAERVRLLLSEVV